MHVRQGRQVYGCAPRHRRHIVQIEFNRLGGPRAQRLQLHRRSPAVRQHIVNAACRVGVTHVVLCGIATSAGVESTARFSHELGFNVTFALDAMTDMSAEAHENSAVRVFPRIGETGSTAAVLAELERRAMAVTA